MLFQGEDDHYCLKCGSTISGIDNYINHRKSDCRVVEAEKKASEHLPEPTLEDKTPTDQFFSVLQLQRRSEVTSCEKTVSGIFTRSKVKNIETNRNGKTNLEVKKPKKNIIKKQKKFLKKSESDVSDVLTKKSDVDSLVLTENDLWLPFVKDDKPNKAEICPMSPMYIVDLPEVRDTEVDKFLQDVHYNYDNLIGIDDIVCETPKDGSKNKSSFLFEQSDWDLLDEVPELNRKKTMPPPSYTGGKWKPMLTPETGGKCRSVTPVEIFGKFDEIKSPDLPVSESFWRKTEQASYPSPSHTGGKWAPHNSTVPPIEHTRGKWAPGSQVSGKFLKTSSGRSEYFCVTCQRRLASKEMYKRHTKSDYHIKRLSDENDLECDARSFKFNRRRENDCGKRNIKVPVKYEPTVVSKKIKMAVKEEIKKDNVCVACKTKIRRGLLGKHLVSYHHYRRSNLNNPDHQKQILSNIDVIMRQAPYQCSPCHFYCNTAHQFRYHWATENHNDNIDNSNYWCSFCKFYCSSGQQVLQHLDSREHYQVICSINGSMPIIIRQPKVIKCNRCQIQFKLNVQLKHHNTNYHDNNLGVKQYHFCDSCNFKSISRKSLQNHMVKAHGKSTSNFFCTLCQLSFNSAQEAKDHRNSMPHRYAAVKKKVDCGEMNLETLKRKCPQCSLVFDSPQDLIQHQSNAHMTVHICLRCGKEFSYAQHVTRHIASGKCDFLPRNAADINRKLYNCSECSFGSNLKADLMYHQLLHSTSKDTVLLTCPVCQKLFSRKKMRSHLQRHTSELPFECDRCSKRFACRKVLKEHQANKCNKRNMKKLDKERPSLQCQQCNYVGKTPSLLRRHMLFHQDSRGFACPHCSFKANILDHLKRHLRLHTGAKPFKCPYCKYACNALENLRKHVIKTGSHVGRRMYECSHCNFSSNISKDFDEHLSKTHPGIYDPAGKENLWGIYQPMEDVIITDNPLKIARTEKIPSGDEIKGKVKNAVGEDKKFCHRQIQHNFVNRQLLTDVNVIDMIPTTPDDIHNLYIIPCEDFPMEEP